MLENPVIMKDGDHVAVWVWLLLHAPHEPRDVFFKGQRTRLQPGQITVGRRQIGEDLCIDESKVRRVLDLFENDQQIDQEMSNKCRLITLKNWAAYQKTDQQNDRQLTNKRPASDRQVTTKQEAKNVRMKEVTTVPSEPAPLEADAEAINKVLSFFQAHLNPVIKYGHKTQRQACADLLRKMSIDKIEKLVLYCAKVRDEPFAPIVTTPWQLLEKLAHIHAYYEKKSNKPSNVVSI